jgi:hypothetical protein
MATTTPNYGWTVPTSTDLVKDGATAIETLGDAIDASMNTALGTKKAGMVLLNTTSFSAVSSQAINSVFNATYTNYKVIVNYTNCSANQEIYLRMRVGGVSNSTASSYIQQGSTSIGASLSNLTQTTTYIYVGELNSTVPTYSGSNLDILNPFTAIATKFNGQMNRANTAAAVGSIAYNAVHNQATSYDGIEIYTSTGTMTGTVSVYGYNI